MEIKREHLRAMIYYDFRVGLTKKQCVERLQKAFNTDAPSEKTVYNWYNEFHRSRSSLTDAAREGRPRSAVVPENIEAVRLMITDDNRITYSTIHASLGIGMKQIQTILHKHLRVRKLCCRWIPHALTPEQKQARVDWCKNVLSIYRKGRSNSVYNIVTGDESWIYSFEPERKRQSAQWVFPEEPKPTKVKQARSVGKKMIATFFAKPGHVCTIPVEDKKTVTAEWYTNVCLPKVIENVRKKRPRGVIVLHHDNAPPHTAGGTKSFLQQNNISLLGHPPYSPDLAPCDFFLFPTIKNKMAGLKFSTPEAAVTAYEQLISEIQQHEWQHCFQQWFERMEKCINVQGEYFEKQ